MSSEQIIQQAANWLTRLHDEDVSDTDRQAFNAWCQADPRHAVAIERMRSLWGSLDTLPAQPARIALNRAFAPQRARGAQVVGLLGVLLCGWLGLEHLPVWMADQRTGVGERRQIALEDGSQLQLNSNSAVDVKFDGHQRVIELLQGELWVDVAKDAQRPFVVRTDQGTATALGTRYMVKRAADGTTVVTVIESTVAVKGEGADSVKVAAGQRSILDHGHAQAAQAIANTDPDAWTRGLLKVNDQPLGEVLQTLASYRHGVVRFDAQALRDVRVSGVFKLDDSAAALSALADNLPIRVEYFTDLLVVVKPR
ncbi:MULTISPECIES: FecR family protein [Pseudomonas]|jgi:transmembrane sensor|uniref:FecR family protein n=1 Tax=Pseudomonas fluorescens TaxID=294 RepID=A0A7M2J1M0_PSEFL|nr:MULTISPECIES: FecR family protein [Pseudomonas]PMX18662.1 iron dicitrate transport regulator FecR [Pseudomonas sp. GW460-12]PMX34387.1 iron dicitrate transport regulator FecR [Pseudomonas sp. MPR-R2A4]PMX37059.1 iron dicitrate transport regulator FecR [Pseudomonas sp. MPR-R2A7]PMX49251.1 iron dicitrate transport regulator FecR [Pseudomonas sp. MPR-R2A6]PMX87974.1 iron dicitrate transport regulator FecR [Pseudomonas sp. MPR-R2A3]